VKKLYKTPEIEWDGFQLKSPICSQLYGELYSGGSNNTTTIISPSYEGAIGDAGGEIRPTRPRG
jgi:hypothetical protein